ncbi:leucine rich repeat-containing protein [Besnoitia besnoiti]|uniref:Leucine-rich repeat-containing protein 51 n=1 Tax=Besnoitia besnoiti TaxID=94643 RepID=A0A2A9MPM0_BESBE|nr:leucine rich repeat-containing protein [Besnoitia besnoiti]PFH38023.1 leucine rich repeat-containing protein [Besnoitia besnoiti]
MQNPSVTNCRRSPSHHDYIVPSAPIDLSFRNYKSPTDILPEHATTAGKGNSPCSSSEQATRKTSPPSGFPPQPARPTFIIALAFNNGEWPSCALAGSPENISRKKNEPQFRVTFSEAETSLGGQCLTQSTPLVSASDPRSLWAHAFSEPQSSQHYFSSCLPHPSGFRSSVCLSRHSSTVSLCTQPKNGFEGTVLDLHSPGKIHVKLTVTAVRLCNNQMTSLEELVPALCRIMPTPKSNLQWLDLAFNQLVAVHPVLQQLSELRTLYLHCNLIANYTCLLPLKGMPKLRTLTLMGNPVEVEDYSKYRIAILAALPRLKSLDHTAVSDDEVAAAEHFRHHQALKRQKGINDKRSEEWYSMY